MAVTCYQDDIDGGIFSSAKNGSESVPSTPAFPLSPETPYGKDMSASIYLFIKIVLLTFYLLLKRNCIFPSLLVKTPPLHHQQIASSLKVSSPSELYRTSPGKILILLKSFETELCMKSTNKIVVILL